MQLTENRSGSPPSRKLNPGLRAAALAAGGAVALGGASLSGADRLIDGGYDRAISRAGAGPVLAAARPAEGFLRLASQPGAGPKTAGPKVAETEHAWLTRTELARPELGNQSAPVPTAVIPTAVGERLTISGRDGKPQTLEIVDVRELLAEKILIVSAKVVTDGAMDGPAIPGALIRFVVEANARPAATAGIPPRAL
jgi:hypothetical protein